MQTSIDLYPLHTTFNMNIKEKTITKRGVGMCVTSVDGNYRFVTTIEVVTNDSLKKRFIAKLERENLIILGGVPYSYLKAEIKKLDAEKKNNIKGMHKNTYGPQSSSPRDVIAAKGLEQIRKDLGYG